MSQTLQQQSLIMWFCGGREMRSNGLGQVASRFHLADNRRQVGR